MEKAKDTLRAQQLEALTLKQFKVSVVTMGLHNFTVMANSEKAAIDKVMTGQGGREAGKEGPVPYAFMAYDMSIIQPSMTLEQVMKNMQQGGSLNPTNAADAAPPLITTSGE